MLLKKVLLVIVLSVYYNVTAQDHFLISINIGNKPDQDKISNLKLPVYHLSESVLITEASEKLLGLLSNDGIIYEIIDREPNSNKYFIVNKKKIKTGTDNVSEKLIYSDKENAIFKKTGMEIIKNDRVRKFEVELYKKPYFFESKKILPPSSTLINNDSLISKVVSLVDEDSVRFFIKSLQEFQTRFLLSPTRDSVAGWIKHQFLRMGYTNVRIDSFYKAGVWNKNVIATLNSAYGSEQEIVVGGHHDSYSSGDPMVFAPGADDNASGTAAVLEIARVLKKANYLPDSKIVFVTFAAEEYGLYGGYDYAQKANSEGKNIKLMINHDMISNNRTNINDSRINIIYYTGSEDYRELAKSSTNKFTKIKALTGYENSSGSDSYAFWTNGYPAVYFEEYNFSPVYHSPQDIISNCNTEYCSEVIKGSCATLLNTDFMPSKVDNFSIADNGNGNSLHLTWRKNTETDLAGYQIGVGKTSGIYDSIITTTDTNVIVGGLSNGIKYYFGISTFDTDGNRSFILEKSFIPRIIPLSPSGLTDYPLMHKIMINWYANKENDLLGYNIFRTISGNNSAVKVNDAIVVDTFYIDDNPLNGVYYSYQVFAVDSSLNFSEPGTIKSRAVSLDQGILVIDATLDGNGAITKPTDGEVDLFYSNLLSGFNKKDFDVLNDGLPKLADIGAFSTVLLHINQNTDINLSDDVLNGLRQYLEFGGNFIFTGYMPSLIFANNSLSDEAFSQGNFIYDYLKIKKSFRGFGSRFCGANSTDYGYPSIFTDSSKLSSGTNYCLKDIESIEPCQEAKVIYRFNSNYDSSTAAGKMKGLSVGIEYLGKDYNTVILSFPLYFMKQNEAKEFVNNILTNKFNESNSTGADEHNDIPLKFYLSQNYPNPFNPVTKLKYSIPSVGTSLLKFVQLKVYDILGKEVANLVNELKSPGIYEIEFDAGNLTSGIYFYQLKASTFISTKKMLLIK